MIDEPEGISGLRLACVEIIYFFGSQKFRLLKFRWFQGNNLSVM